MFKLDKKIKWVLAFTLILLSFESSLSQTVISNIEIITSGNVETIYTSERSTIEVTVKNTGLSKDTFIISPGVWPSKLQVTVGLGRVTLNPGESEVIKLTFEPTEDAETGTVLSKFSVTSLNTGLSEYKDIIINVRRRTGTYISEIKLNQEIVKPGETLSIQPVLVNLDKTQSKHLMIKTKITKDKVLIQSFEEEVLLEPAKTQTLTTPFFIYNKYVYGIYNIETEMRDALGQTIHKKTANFAIQKFDDIKEEKTIISELLSRTVIINVTNKGNIPDSSYLVTESMPRTSKYFFYPEIEPTSEETKDNRIVYSWLISDLDPDQSRLIVYQFRYSNIVIVSSIIFLLFLIAITYYYKPTLAKKYPGKLSSDKETLVTLHLKNNSRSEIHNAIVRDKIPPIAVLVKEFTTIQPEIRTTHSGTDLIWRIDKLKPGEERILTYKIKPVMDIEGKTKLPKAYFTYRRGKGLIRKIAEKIVVKKNK